MSAITKVSHFSGSQFFFSKFQLVKIAIQINLMLKSAVNRSDGDERYEFGENENKEKSKPKLKSIG